MGKQKKPNFVLGLDLDGVIVDHFENKAIALRQLGFSVARKDLASDILGTKLPIGEWRAAQNFLYDDLRSALEPDLFEGVFDALRLLKERETECFLISRRKIPETAVKLLKKRKLWPKFFNSQNTFFVETPRDKDQKAVELGIAHYVDDQPSVLKELKSVKNKFLFDPLDSYGHSRHYKKISSWKEFLKELAQ